jgi:hypothetical protein
MGQHSLQECAQMTKHSGGLRRLTGMHAPMRQIAFSAIRTGALVALAMLLILGLLPAILAVQAAGK